MRLRVEASFTFLDTRSVEKKLGSIAGKALNSFGGKRLLCGQSRLRLVGPCGRA